LFLFLVSIAIDRDTAKHIVRIAGEDGNSGTVGEGVDVSEGEAEAVGECFGVAVGEVDGLEVDDEPEGDDVGLGVGVESCLGVGDGPLLLSEL
jgi:hypothetical protein